MQQFLHALLRIESPQKEEDGRAIQPFAQGTVRVDLDTVGHDGNGVGQAVGPECLGLGRVQRPQARGAANMLILEPAADHLLLPLRPLQRPRVEHPAWRDDIGPTVAPMAAQVHERLVHPDALHIDEIRIDRVQGAGDSRRPVKSPQTVLGVRVHGLATGRPGARCAAITNADDMDAGFRQSPEAARHAGHGDGQATGCV
jgi:hypothetical protein